MCCTHQSTDLLGSALQISHVVSSQIRSLFVSAPSMWIPDPLQPRSRQERTDMKNEARRLFVTNLSFLACERGQNGSTNVRLRRLHGPIRSAKCVLSESYFSGDREGIIEENRQLFLTPAITMCNMIHLMHPDSLHMCVCACVCPRGAFGV